jgi:hypothetical protein
VCIQSGLASTPPETLSHSTTTVPLKSRALTGRFTTTRDLKSASDESSTVQRPSLERVDPGAGEKTLAVPDRKNSDCS